MKKTLRAVLFAVCLAVSSQVLAAPGPVSLTIYNGSVQDVLDALSSISGRSIVTDGDIKGKHVLIVEDIIDTGITMQSLIRILMEREPLDIRVCAAFDKPSRRVVEVNIDYIGKQIPDAFIVGYGLDYAERYRNLPHVSVLEIYGGDQ